MGIITMGLSQIEFGEIAADGGVATAWSQLGKTSEDSCSFVQEDPTETEHYVEEQDDPIVIQSKKGKSVLKFSIADPSLEALEALCGGSIVDGAWNAPSSATNIEKSVKVTPQVGIVLTIPRGKVVGKINATMSKKNLFMVDVTVTALTPTKSGVAPVIAKELGA